MANQNHPKKGDQIAVEPIKAIKDIKSIKKLLADSPRDLAIFTLGINTNLRASDLLKLTVDQVINAKAGDEIHIKEQKTKKPRRITLNQSVVDAVQSHISAMQSKPGFITTGPLFLSQRGDKPLEVSSLSRLVKSWCRSINLPGNYASHTLRKTWGYHQRVTFNVGIPELMVCFNHTSQKQTLDYLCIQPEEIRGVYMNEL